MTFDFDPAKSAVNKQKHGIDFREAQELWTGRTVSVRLAFPAEARRLVIGEIGGRLWVAIVTERGDVTRLISVRRARKKEQQIYEQT